MVSRLVILPAIFMVVASSLASAQPYPDRPLKLIIPYPAGTATDIFGRQLSGKLGELLGQPVVVDNRGGAGGIIGTEATAKSPPDGYTIMLATSQTHAVNKSLYKSLPYDPIENFAPIARLGTQAMILVTNATVPVKSVQEFVSYAKARPGQLNFASTGSGTSAHLCGVLLNREAGLDITHVPYKGAGQALADLVGGQITMMFYPYLAIQSQIQAGKVTVLGGTGNQRTAYLPNTPTMIESGYPNFVLTVWFASYAPAGTPRPIIDRLADAFAKTMNDTDVKKVLLASGTDNATLGPDELARFTRTELERYRKLVEASGAKVD